jgi:hypothetical protein
VRSLIVDDEEGLEQIVALLLLGFLHLGAMDMLDNNGPVCHHLLDSEDGVINVALLIIHLRVIDLIFNIRGADVTSIIGGDVCPLAGAILLHVANFLALVAANPGCVAGGGNRRGTISRLSQSQS